MAKAMVDFSDADKGGARVRVKEGDYRVKCTDVKLGESKSSGNSMLTWTFVGTEGKLKGKEIKDYTVLTKEAAWKLKKVFEAFGIEIPTKKLDIVPLLKKVKGVVIGVTLTDDEYEKDDGKTTISSKISDYMSEDVLDGSDADEDDDDEPKEKKKKKSKDSKGGKEKGKKKKGKKKSDDDDEIEDLDLDEL